MIKNFNRQIFFSSTNIHRRNPYSALLTPVQPGNNEARYYDVNMLNPSKIERLPYSHKILLENVVRNSNEASLPADIQNILKWKECQGTHVNLKPSSMSINDDRGFHLNISLPQGLKNIKIYQLCTEGDDEASNFNFDKGILSIESTVQNEQNIIFPNLVAGVPSLSWKTNSSGLLTSPISKKQTLDLFHNKPLSKIISPVYGIRLSGTPSAQAKSEQVINHVMGFLKQKKMNKLFVQIYGPSVSVLTEYEKESISKLAMQNFQTTIYFPPDENSITKSMGSQEQAQQSKKVLENLGLFKNQKEDYIQYTRIEEINLSKIQKGQTHFIRKPDSAPFDCKKLKMDIKSYISKKIESLESRPKVSIILAHDKDGKPNPASQIYVKNKMQLLPEVGISAELIKVTPDITKQQMEAKIKQLNEDCSNTSTMIQLPFSPEYKFNINQIINQVDEKKNIDGFGYVDQTKPNFENPKTLKPPTALGIATLLKYYGIKTQGKKIAIIGKGALVGAPLAEILTNYPYNGTVTTCDIFTENPDKITKQADIIVAACGSAEFLKKQNIKNGVILVDAGINEVVNTDNNSKKKRKITGDICKQAYNKAKLYTAVPGGVGLLTVSAMAFNVLNSYLMSEGKELESLQNALHNKFKLSQYQEKIETKTQKKVMLISSAYNGLTQKIDKVLTTRGHNTYFQVASSDQAMRKAVQQFQPEIIICPTLMKAIPQDIYTKIKCLIVHPGIKGDRGPSSIDWAILNQEKEWGVTLLEADKEMDAGDIWGTTTFPISPSQSKVEIYNSLVSKAAEKLILQALDNLGKQNFKPEKLDYSNPSVKGNLHRTIKQSDKQRLVNWKVEKTGEIIKKAKAADTQPGLKVNLKINGQSYTRFTYGYVEEKQITPPNDKAPGEIFLRKNEAVCVKTCDGAVWIKQMRKPKSKQNSHPFKVASVIHLGPQALKNIPEVTQKTLQKPNKNTFQELTFQKHGEIGIFGFDFYNGAMSTEQCERMANSLKAVSERTDIKVLVLKGSKTSWSNGIHLNVIQNANSPEEEAWANIKAINKIVKEIYNMKNKLTIAAIQTNAGAGGVYLGTACDYCFVKQGSVLNPHYKNMGLFGSELHTPSAIRKFGLPTLEYLKDSAQPLIVEQAIQLDLIDKLEDDNQLSFMDRVMKFVNNLQPEYNKLILQKKENINMLFKYKKCQQYEEEELREMYLDIFENRNNFAEKRQAFVKKLE